MVFLATSAHANRDHGQQQSSILIGSLFPAVSFAWVPLGWKWKNAVSWRNYFTKETFDQSLRITPQLLAHVGFVCSAELGTSCSWWEGCRWRWVPSPFPSPRWFTYWHLMFPWSLFILVFLGPLHSSELPTCSPASLVRPALSTACEMWYLEKGRCPCVLWMPEVWRPKCLDIHSPEITMHLFFLFGALGLCCKAPGCLIQGKPTCVLFLTHLLSILLLFIWPFSSYLGITTLNLLWSPSMAISPSAFSSPFPHSVSHFPLPEQVWDLILSCRIVFQKLKGLWRRDFPSSLSHILGLRGKGRFQGGWLRTHRLLLGLEASHLGKESSVKIFDSETRLSQEPLIPVSCRRNCIRGEETLPSGSAVPNSGAAVDTDESTQWVQFF